MINLPHRLRLWNQAFQALSPGETREPTLGTITAHSIWGFASIHEERAWYEQGVAIARDLDRELARLWVKAGQTKGRIVVRVSRLEHLIKHSLGNQNLPNRKADDRAQEIAGQCGIPEIGRIIERLDELAVERQSLPEWDGDTHDDISEAQLMFAKILGVMPSHYLGDIAKDSTPSNLIHAFTSPMGWQDMARSPDLC